VNHNAPEWVESRFPNYAAVSIQALYCGSELPIYNISSELPLLLVVSNGSGSLHTQEQIYELTEGSAVFLPANTYVTLLTERGKPLHAYQLSISTLPPVIPATAVASTKASALLATAGLLHIPSAATIVTYMEELYFNRLPVRELRHAQNQLLVHQLVLMLLELHEANSTVSEQGMEQTIAYIEQHYASKITREQLSGIAGVSEAHYSVLFKRLTGYSSSEYISRLRIHRAIELLKGTGGMLREIAQKVGFKDEFYLSRRFKQQTGCSPSSYMAEAPQRIAVLLTPYGGHLLALGIKPSVEMLEQSGFIEAEGLNFAETTVFIDSECTLEQIKAALVETNTQLIITTRQSQMNWGPMPEQLRVIAPVVEVPWLEVGWKTHLLLIAKAVQRSEEAERWLANFEREELKARQHIQALPVAEEVITILVLDPKELLVYGARNIGYTIYHSLGLRPPAIIGKALEEYGEQFHAIPIEAEELGDYAGDRLLVIVFSDVTGSMAHADRIFESTHWQSLPAVQRKAVHMLDQEEWVPYNPISISLQLQRAVALFDSIR